MPLKDTYGAHKARFEAREREIAHRRAHLFGRIHPPQALIPGERYDVDLEIPRFAVYWGEEVASEGTAQLIGTLSKGTWMWGWHNPSIHENGTAELRAWADGQEELRPLFDRETFRLSREKAELMAGWIALEADYLGPYPAEVGSTTAYVGVRFTHHHGAPEPKLPWCTLCGFTQRQRKLMIGGQYGNLCSDKDCLGQYVDIVRSIASAETGSSDLDAFVELIKAKAAENPSTPLSSSSCMMCGGSVRLVMHHYTGMCVECVVLAERVFTQDG